MATIGRLKSVAITTTGTGGTAIATVLNPISGSIIEDDELVKKVYSNTRKAKYYAGEEVQGVSFTCADRAVWAACKKGNKVTSCVLVFEGTVDSDGTLETGTVTATVTNGIIDEAPTMESSTDGAPAEFTVKVMTHDVDGSELAIT